MGIKDYHTWIKSSFPNCLIESTNNNIYEYIYIDMNYILHLSIYGCNTITEFIQKIYHNLDVIFINFIATKQIFFALDGTSSYAKIILQRERRSKPLPATQINQKIDFVGLSPGTKLMKFLEKKIRMYINNLNGQYKFIKPEFIFSKSSKCDEGEIKICKQVFINGSNNLNHRHLIVGNDADIIVLSMGLKPIYNINILVNGNGNRDLISLKNLLGSFATLLNINSDMYVMANNNLRDDFVLVSLMMGNDYFPKLHGVNYIKLWDCYYTFFKQTNQTIINNGKFDIENLKIFTYLIYSNMAATLKTIAVDVYDKQKVKSYLEGLIWCLKIYNTGICTNYEYNYTSTIPVHPFELYFYLFSENDIISYGPQFSLPVNAEIYPLLIMPYNAKYLIPQKYHSIMDDKLKYLYEVENCNECKRLHNSCQKLHKSCQDTKHNNDGLCEKFNKMYREKYLEHSTHKKTHTFRFSSDDIKYIINLCNEIK